MACMSHALLAAAEPIPNDEDVGVLQRRIRELTGLLARERLARERAEYKLRDLLRRLYGPKSEQFDSGQYALLLAQFEADQSLAQAQPPLPSMAPAPTPGAARRGGGRRPAPEHLPVERVVLDPPAADTAGLVRIREEITEELDYRPSRFIRRHYVRGVYVDPARERAPLIAALPARVLPQAAVGPGLLAHVLVAKYTDHTPLARQERIAARAGVELPRQKLVRWVEGAALLLRSVHERLIERVLDSGYVQVDETPIRVLDPDRGGHAAQAYLWTYLAPRAEALVFDFDLSRSRANPTAFFPTPWSGVLQSDGYEVYRRLATERPGLVHAGCMAHLRRHVFDAFKAGAPEAAELIAGIGALYAIEREARELAPEARAARRAEACPPIFTRLHARFMELAIDALPQSALGKAATYAVNQWAELTRYAAPGLGHVFIDNNSVERSIRPTKLGAKNWLFIGHPSAGWRSAVIYSITGTCQLLKVNPEQYLAWVLPRLATARSHDTGGLLPHDYAALDSS